MVLDKHLREKNPEKYSPLQIYNYIYNKNPDMQISMQLFFTNKQCNVTELGIHLVEVIPVVIALGLLHRLLFEPDPGWLGRQQV